MYNNRDLLGRVDVEVRYIDTRCSSNYDKGFFLLNIWRESFRTDRAMQYINKFGFA